MSGIKAFVNHIGSAILCLITHLHSSSFLSKHAKEGVLLFFVYVFENLV